MADKEEGNSSTNEPLKSEEAPASAASDEPPPSLETIPEGTTARSEALPVVTKDKGKIDVVLRATGNAPIMKQKKWTVNQDQPIGSISEFIRKYLKLEPSERLFLYVHQTFAPAPDQTIKNLYECFGADGKLVINYCKSQAWG